MSWSTVVTMFSVTLVASTVVLGILFVLVLNPDLRQMLGRRLRRQPYYPDMIESRLYGEALRLRGCVDTALRGAPISLHHRTALRGQAAEVPHNVALALARLHRVREVKKDLYASPLPNAYLTQKREVAALERELLAELRGSLEVLSSVPISLMRVEMLRDEMRVKQVVADIADSNTRMRELAQAWQELG